MVVPLAHAGHWAATAKFHGERDNLVLGWQSRKERRAEDKTSEQHAEPTLDEITDDDREPRRSRHAAAF